MTPKSEAIVGVTTRDCDILSLLFRLIALPARDKSFATDKKIRKLHAYTEFFSHTNTNVIKTAQKLKELRVFKCNSKNVAAGKYAITEWATLWC